jgi:hypothetical protein
MLFPSLPMFDCHRQLDLKGSCSHSHDWISFSTHSHDWISFSTHSHDWISFSTKEIINCVVTLTSLYMHMKIFFCLLILLLITCYPKKCVAS